MELYKAKIILRKTMMNSKVVKVQNYRTFENRIPYVIFLLEKSEKK